MKGFKEFPWWTLITRTPARTSSSEGWIPWKYRSRNWAAGFKGFTGVTIKANSKSKAFPAGTFLGPLKTAAVTVSPFRRILNPPRPLLSQEGGGGGLNRTRRGPW